MTLSVRERILAAVATQLATVAGVTVYRNRRREVDAARLPALVLTDGGASAPVDVGVGYALYTLEAEVEGIVTAATDAALGPAISDLYAKALAALMADRTFGNLAIDAVDGNLAVDLDRGEGAAPTGAFGLTINITYATKPGDPYTLAPA